MKNVFFILSFLGVMASSSVLHAEECQLYFEGCGSCVADGVWGSLVHNKDCSIGCDKVCGNEPAEMFLDKSDYPSGAELSSKIRLQYNINLSIWKNPIFKPQAKYKLDFEVDHNNNDRPIPEKFFASFDNTEFNKLKNKTNKRLVFTIKNDQDSKKLKTYLGEKDHMAVFAKMANELSSLAVEAQIGIIAGSIGGLVGPTVAIGTTIYSVGKIIVDAVSGLKEQDIEIDKGHISALMTKGAKVYVSESISQVPFVVRENAGKWVYTQMLSLESQVNQEKILTIISIFRAPTEIK